MLRKESKYLILFMAVFMAVIISNSHAQYNGECWATDYTNVVKIAGGKATKVAGFSQPLSVSINAADGSCWVADTDAINVRKLSAAGKQLAKIEGVFETNPSSVAVDPRDGSCWIGVMDSIFKFSADAKQLFKRDGFNEPVLAVNPKNGECWIADSNNARVVKMSPEGSQLKVITIDGISQPKSISVNPNDGYCWVLDPFTQKAAKLSSDGAILVQATVAPAGGTAIMAPCLTASGDGGCWVALMVDTINDTVLKLSADGKQALKVSGFAMPSGLAFDPKDNGCWVADSNHGAIIKISSAGKIVANIKGFDQPKAITVAYPVKQ